MVSIAWRDDTLDAGSQGALLETAKELPEARDVNRKWVGSVMGLVLALAAVSAAQGATGRSEPVQEPTITHTERTPSRSESLNDSTAVNVTVMRSFEVDTSPAINDPTDLRTNGSGGYTRRLSEVDRSGGSSGDEQTSTALVFVYIVTPNY